MLLARTDTAVAYNPVASTWKGKRGPRRPEMMAELGIRFAIGTDGTRSDAFRMIDAAETLQRIAFGPWRRRLFPRAAAGPGSITRPAAPPDAVGLKGRDRRDRGGPRRRSLARRHLRPRVYAVMGPRLGSWCASANRDQIVAVLVAGKLRLWRGWPTDWDARAR